MPAIAVGGRPEKRKVEGVTVLDVAQGDITTIAVDAIVDALRRAVAGTS